MVITVPRLGALDWTPRHPPRRQLGDQLVQI
jgi:hypothetical protein